MSVNSKAFYDFFTEGDWIDSNGNSVKNWKQKLLTWNGFSNNKSKNNTNFEERKYTQEELSSLFANNNFEGEEKNVVN